MQNLPDLAYPKKELARFDGQRLIVVSCDPGETSLSG